MAQQQDQDRDYDATPPDDDKPRQDPVSGTTGDRVADGARPGEAADVQEGLGEQDEAARERAEEKGYQ